MANIVAATQSPSFNIVVAHFNSSGSDVKYFNSCSSVVSWFEGAKWNYWESKKILKQGHMLIQQDTMGKWPLQYHVLDQVWYINK